MKIVIWKGDTLLHKNHILQERSTKNNIENTTINTKTKPWSHMKITKAKQKK